MASYSQIATIATSAQVSADAIEQADIADDAVGLAEMAAGTAGNIITYDASGNPAAVATGTSGHYLKSQGAGAAPVFAAGPAALVTATGVVTRAMNASSGAVTVAHGLGIAPKLVRVTALVANTTTNEIRSSSYGAFDGTNNRCTYWHVLPSTPETTISTDTTNAIHLRGTTQTKGQDCVLSVDATNITFTWANVATSDWTMVAAILWEAIA